MQSYLIIFWVCYDFHLLPLEQERVLLYWNFATRLAASNPKFRYGFQPSRTVKQTCVYGTCPLNLLSPVMGLPQAAK
jgi:hypothetical protein